MCFLITFIITDYKLPAHYQNNPVLLRGCFVLKVPDRCYTAKNGLSYCWCSTKDLCNSATSHTKVFLASHRYVQFIIQYVLAVNSYPQSLLQTDFSMVASNVLVVGFQLFSSAFFWYTYNNVIHRFFLLHHGNILWWELWEVKQKHMCVFLFLNHCCIEV